MMALEIKAHYLFVDDPDGAWLNWAHIQAMTLCAESDSSIDTCFVFTYESLPSTGLWHSRLVASLRGLSEASDWDLFYLGRSSALCDQEEHVSEYLVRSHERMTSDLFAYGYKRSTAQNILSNLDLSQAWMVSLLNALAKADQIKAFAATPNVFSLRNKGECRDNRDGWIKEWESKPWDTSGPQKLCRGLGDYVLGQARGNGMCETDDLGRIKWGCEEALSLMDGVDANRNEVEEWLEKVNRELAALEMNEKKKGATVKSAL